MSWNQYIDPGLVENSQSPSWSDLWGPRQQNALGQNRGYGEWGADALDTGKSLASLLAPNLMEGHRPPVESAMLDLGAWLQAPERGAMAAKAAISPLAAGMIRWAPGKEYPNAILHRAIGDPSELGWWARLFQKNKSSQAPTSVVTPSVLQTFQSEPYGLLFNVNEPDRIKHAGFKDLSSLKDFATDPSGSGIGDILNRIWSTKTRRAVSIDNPIDRNALEDKYMHAYRKLQSKPVAEPYTWTPLDTEYLINDNEDLGDLLRRQLQSISSGSPGSRILTHSEVIPEIDRSMLAGVRLPLEDITDWHNNPLGIDGWNSRIRALRNFAEQQNVPIYRWPAVQTIDQEIKGLSGDPFRGKWGWKPGTREYITSSRLPEIFGITELP